MAQVMLQDLARNCQGHAQHDRRRPGAQRRLAQPGFDLALCCGDGQPGADDGSVGSPTPDGEYPITITQETLASARYQFAFVNGTLAVTPRTVPTLTWTTPSPIVYGTPLDFAQLNASASDISGTVEGQYTYIPTVGELLGAGEHSLLVTFAPDDLTTYYTTTKRVSLIVTQAPLTVAADNQTRGYGLENPRLTLSYQGFVGGTTRLISPPTAETTATATTP